MEEFLNSGSEINELETYLQGFSGTISCILSGQPFRDEEGSVNGGVLIFNPLKKLRSLVNRISGAHASFTFQDIIGQNPKLLEAVQTARLAADKRSNILLQGESGTGKELFAQAIHNASSRRHGPFVALNCGAIPRELLGSELFGYVDGAFTGARKGGRTGKFDWLPEGRCFWMKSAKCLWASKSLCCGPFRKKKSLESVMIKWFRLTCALSVQP